MKYPDFKNGLGKTVFPIGAWGCVGVDETGVDSITDETFSLMKDCGINFVVSANVYGSEAGKRFAKMCGKYSIGHFIEDQGINSLTGEESQEKVDEVVSAAISSFGEEKCYLGPFFKDEPNKAGFKRLAKLYGAFRQTGAKGLPYVNLLPAVKEGPLDIDPGYKYERYIEDFISIADPAFLSFDCYLFGTGLKGECAINGNDAFESFSRISAASRKYGIPFWSFVQCGGQWGSPVIEQEMYPNKAQFDFSVHISLAFGAKGIEYFTFRQPGCFYAPTCFEGSSGMIGYKGAVNKWYYFAKDINAFISRVGNKLLRARHEGVLFLGGSCMYPAFGGAVISGVGYEELGYSEADHALLGIFSLESGGRLIYVVNNSFTEQTYVGLRFDKKRDFILTDANGSRKATAFELRKENCLLIEGIPAGEAVLIEYDL